MRLVIAFLAGCLLSINCFAVAVELKGARSCGKYDHTSPSGE